MTIEEAVVQSGTSEGEPKAAETVEQEGKQKASAEATPEAAKVETPASEDEWAFLKEHVVKQARENGYTPSKIKELMDQQSDPEYQEKVAAEQQRARTQAAVDYLQECLASADGLEYIEGLVKKAKGEFGVETDDGYEEQNQSKPPAWARALEERLNAIEARSKEVVTTSSEVQRKAEFSEWAAEFELSPKLRKVIYEDALEKVKLYPQKFGGSGGMARAAQVALDRLSAARSEFQAAKPNAPPDLNGGGGGSGPPEVDFSKLSIEDRIKKAGEMVSAS